MFVLSLLILFFSGIYAAPNPYPLDGRIVGGHSTDISKHPWLVSFQFNNTHFCGGAVLTKQWIVTAAHCFYDEDNVNNFIVRAGSTYTNVGGQLFKIAKHIVHPDWVMSDSILSNDIALVKLDSEITTSVVKPLSLPLSNSDMPDGASVVVSGWGLTNENATSSPTSLLEVILPKVSDGKCVEIYSKARIAVTDVMLCAGIIGTAGKGPCDGDSGGPATYNNQLVGIVSWALGCASATYPSVYVKVSKYVEWINSNID